MQLSEPSRRFWKILIVVLSLVSILPFWIGRFFPSQDLASLMVDAFALHHYNEPSFDFRTHYDLKLKLHGYWGFAAPVYVLHFLFPIEISAKIALSLFVIGMPFSIRALLQSLGRDERLCILGIPLGFTLSTYIGLLTYLFALPFLILALANWQNFLSESAQHKWSPRARQFLSWSILLAIITFFAHVLAAMVLVPLLLVLLVMHRARPWTVLFLIPIPLLILFGGIGDSSGGTLPKSYGEQVLSLNPYWPPYMVSLERLATQLVLHRSGFANQVWLGLYLFTLALLIIGKNRVVDRNDRIAIVLFFAMMNIYLLTPDRLGIAFYLAPRFISLVAVVFLLLPGADVLSGTFGKVRAALIVLVSVTHTCVTSLMVYKFQERVGPFSEIIAKASNGGRTIMLDFNPGIIEPEGQEVLHHFDAYLQLYHGGDRGYSTARYSNHQVIYRPGQKGYTPKEFYPGEFRWLDHGAKVNRILMLGQPSEYRRYYRWKNRFANAQNRISEKDLDTHIALVEAEIKKVERNAVSITHAGPWTLFELPDPTLRANETK